MKVSIDKTAKTITVVMPLEEATPSSSGKTMVVASTRGNLVSDAELAKGKPLIVGLNIYYKP